MRTPLPSSDFRPIRPYFARCHGQFLALAALILSCAVSFSADVRQIDDPSAWDADVKSQYDAIRALPGAPKDPVITAITKLAKKGVAARPALAALAIEAALPEPQRAMSGIMSAYFIRYDLDALRAAASPGNNPFQQRQSIEFLADIGGPQVKEFLGNLGSSAPMLTAYIGRILPKAPAAEAVSEDTRRMLSNILLQPTKVKLSAAVALAELHQGDSTLDPWLEALVFSPVSDDDTQIHAAIALVKIHGKSVPELAALCGRKKHRYVRYNAVQELALKGPAGEAVLRELLASPDEPLGRQIEAVLQKK